MRGTKPLTVADQHFRDDFGHAQQGIVLDAFGRADKQHLRTQVRPHRLKDAASVVRRHDADYDLSPAQRFLQALVQATVSGMRSPGRNFWFTRRAAMLSRTSGSCAHRRTRWVRLRPSTMEIAVPHAPAPMTAISLTNCSL